MPLLIRERPYTNLDLLLSRLIKICRTPVLVLSNNLEDQVSRTELFPQRPLFERLSLEWMEIVRQ